MARDINMKRFAMLLLGICSAATWLVVLVATGFSPVAIGTGLLGIFVLEGRSPRSRLPR